MNCIRTATALLVACAFTVVARAQDFSAIGVSRDTTGHVVKSKVYRSGKKVRYDPQEAVTANERAYVIVDLAQRTSTVVNVGQKTYMQKPADRSTLQLYASGASPCPPVVPAGGTCKDDGPEAVAGRHAEKWEMSQSMGGGGQPNQQTVVSRIWVDAKLQIWVKVETTAGATPILSNELQNIQEGSQPASLFEIPSDYRKMTPQDYFRK